MNMLSSNKVIPFALVMYLNEPCRVCGKNIEPEDLEELVFAGYSADNKSRAAHNRCWRQDKPKDQWAYPYDDKEE